MPRPTDNFFDLSSFKLIHPPVLPVPNYYPEELLLELNRRFHVVERYLSGELAYKLATTFNLTAHSIRSLAEDLAEHRSLKEIIKRQFTYRGKFGLLLAEAEVLAFKGKHHRNPSGREMPGIKRACMTKKFASLGIHSWNELLLHTVGEITVARETYTADRAGLDRAVSEIRSYKQEYQRPPRANEFSTIRKAISRGKWKQFGIVYWNDLLREAIGEVNVQAVIYTRDEAGLREATKKLRHFKRKYQRIPKAADPGLGGVSSAVKKGVWAELGIHGWPDLLEHTFGVLNVKRKSYSGDQQGLDHAMSQLREAYQTHNSYPKSTDQGMGTIVAVIHRQKWTSFGIHKWGDLFQKTFGINPKELRKNIYQGEEGFKRAQQTLREFQEKHYRQPKYADKELNPIRYMATSGKWTALGVESWNDLLRVTFGKVNNEYGVYRGKNGLQNAMKKLHEFNQTHGRPPKTRDKGMKGILGAIRRREWKAFGITSWRELVSRTFDSHE
jgi:hypothetical protein